MVGCGCIEIDVPWPVFALEAFAVCSNDTSLMPLHSDTQQLIRKVEELSGRMVHLTEDPELKVMATISTARGIAPAHFLRYRPNTRAVDYLVAYQLGFLTRIFSCPVDERWEVMSTPEEQQIGIGAMGMTDMPEDFAQSMINHLVIQLRTFSVGARVDAWIWNNLHGLREQQEHAVRSQLAENEQALAPEVRQKFPRPLIDANTAMNAAYALAWGEALRESRFSIPFKALGYERKAKELLEILEETPDDPRADRTVIEQWATALGLDGSFHFELHTLT